MLEFNPAKRITAQEAIENSYFDDIRLPEQEQTDVLPSIKIQVDE
jgi:serine/threonine protein kinase